MNEGDYECMGVGGSRKRKSEARHLHADECEDESVSKSTEHSDVSGYVSSRRS